MKASRTNQHNILNQKSIKRFYDTIDRNNVYTVETSTEKHPFFEILKEFINKWNLYDKKCLEIGSSKGLFQDLVEDYTGVDIAGQLSKYYHKKFIAVTDYKLPFPDNYFEGIFSYATHEHIPEIEESLNELIRVLKPGGVCLFAPAWHTRPWFAQGYQVRSYSELTFKEKLIKVSIPFRDFILIRWPFIFARRLLRLFAYQYFQNKKPVTLKYKRLKANYEKYWHSDSDACNSLDPFDVILWFKSRAFNCHNYNSLLRAIFVRASAIELQKPY